MNYNDAEVMAMVVDRDDEDDENVEELMTEV